MDSILLILLATLVGATVEYSIKRRTGFWPRVLEGRDDFEDEYPYVVALIAADNYKMTLKGVRAYRGCSGSLINDQWVLTAAHCTGSALAKIQYGNMTAMPNSKEATTSKILKWIRHYAARLDDLVGQRKRTNNDLGLLLVDRVKLNIYGKISAVEYGSIMGHAVKYAGFGVTIKSSMNITEQMKTVAKDQKRRRRIGEAIVIPCQNHKDINIGPSICLAPKCTNRGQRASPVDSGGPVLLNGKIAGVACAVVNDVDFRFMPVSPYLDWIHKTITKESY